MNMNTKFTKGEWKWATGDGTEKDVCITTDERNMNSMGNICELDVFFDGEFGIEQKANANLIASSPDMYRLLEACEKTFAALYPSEVKHVQPEHYSEFKAVHHLIGSIQNSLSKARGE